MIFRVPLEVLWKALENKGVCITYIQVTQDMYDVAVTGVWAHAGLAKDFPLTISLYQVWTESIPFYFSNGPT